MATKGERQALLFLAAVAMLGAGTRLYRARHVSGDTSAVDAQIHAVEQQRVAPAGRRSKKTKAAAATVDTAVAARAVNTALAARTVKRVDLDRATEEEIETLPGIGPALARRIVADRHANGAFGCLDALDAVKGIGPAMLKRLDSLTTFSGLARAACVKAAGDSRATSGR